MREPSGAKTIRDPIQKERILEKLHQASEAIELAIKSRIEFESVENSKSFFDIDDNIIDKALKEDPDFSKIQNLIQLSKGDSQANFQRKLEKERDYISNLDQLIEINKTKSDSYQEVIKILSSDEAPFLYEFSEIASHNQGAKVRDQFTSDNQGAKVRESVDQLESSGAEGASPSGFEKDKQKLMKQLQLFITKLTQNNSRSTKLNTLKTLSSAVSECNTELKFREIEKEINPHISKFLKELEIKNLEKEIEKKTRRLEKEKAKKEAEVKAKKEAEVKAKKEAEVKAKKEAEVKAKREVQEQAKREAEAKAKLEAEEQAKLEAEEQAKREAEEKSQKTVAKQQRRAEYIQKESIIEILDQIVKDVTRGLATELAIEERSRLEEDRIKSKTLDDAVDRVENKIIDELLPELVNKVVDELLPELVNKVVDELLPELVNEIVEEIATESFAEAKTEEKAKIEAEGLNEFIAKIISEIITEIEAEDLNEVRTEEGPELRTEFGVKKEDEEIIDRPLGIVETQNDKEISFEQEKEQQSLSIIEKKINELKRYKADIDTKLKDLKRHILTSSDITLSQYKLAISQEQSNSSDHLYIRNLERLAEENKLARRETNITEREGELGQKFIDRQEVKNEAELRAEIEAELRAKIEAELRAKIEAELRAKIESEVKASLEADYKRKIKSDENVLEGRLKQEIEDAKEDFKKEFIAKAKKENEIRAKKEAEIKIREAEIKKTVDTYQKLLEILKKNNSQRLEEKDKKDKEITNLRRELGELRLKLNSLKNPKPDPTTAPLAQPPQVSLKKSINQKDIKQCSPLDLAINQNDKEFAKELIEKGARVSESWQVFYYSKKLDIMKKLYEEGLINFTKFPSELQSFKKSIDDDLNPQNATLKQSFLSFINEKLELEQQTSQGAQGTFLLPTPSQAPTVPGLGILPKPETGPQAKIISTRSK